MKYKELNLVIEYKLMFKDEISKTQKEYYLREQLKAIKKELGEDESSLELKRN